MVKKREATYKIKVEIGSLKISFSSTWGLKLAAPRVTNFRFFSRVHSCDEDTLLRN